MASHNDQEVVISALTGPGPAAVHARDHFHPDGAWQQSQLESACHDNGRTVTYVGDWHSHPRGSRKPSSSDRETARNVSNTASARTPEPITLILTRHLRRYGPHPYIYSDSDLRRVTQRVHNPR